MQLCREGLGGRTKHGRGASGLAGDEGNNKSSVPARTPLSIYGDGALHSFIVCGAPGCEVRTRDGMGYMGGVGRRGLLRSKSFDRLASSDAATHRRSARIVFKAPSPVEKPGRALVQHTCESYRMLYIPKVGPEAVARRRAAAAERKYRAASGSWGMAVPAAARGCQQHGHTFFPPSPLLRLLRPAGSATKSAAL